MPLECWTARVTTRDEDRLDVTRGSGAGDGLVFAPSWAILSPALATFRAIQAEAGPDEVERGAAAWASYELAYTAEMRASYRTMRPAWDTLLSRRRVVLVCYCMDPTRCHRTVLAGILGKLGADVRGELAVQRLAPAGGMTASTSAYQAARNRKRRTA